MTTITTKLKTMISRLISLMTPKSKVSEEVLTLSKLDQALLALKEMSEIKSISPINARTISFKSCESNIVELYDYIDDLSQAYANGAITPRLCFKGLNETNLDLFFTNNGAYVEYESVQHLIRLATEFLTKLHEDQKKNTTNADYVVRLLNKVFVTIIELSKAVSKVRNK